MSDTMTPELAAAQVQVKTLHVVFKTHLDIGYTDFSRNVLQQYFSGFIPRALAVAKELREAGGDARFVWTTGSWLIYHYLEQASALERTALETGIAHGDIVWHGLPFTQHAELIDASLYRYGLSLSRKLDARFGKKTIAAKATDVPGLTRAVIPLLAEAGIQFLHIGANGASVPPEVPPIFTWRDPSGAEIVVMYHNSYGGFGHWPGMSDALSIEVTSDNVGPLTRTAILHSFLQWRSRLPNASVTASTLDNFARALLPHKSELPIFEGEIGDTWIHGVGTDPKKVSQFRALSRLRERWLQSGQIDEDDPCLERFSDKLLMISEHTWGLDEKVHLTDFSTFSAQALAEKRQTGTWRRFEASWAEQRAYLTDAVAALNDQTLQGEANTVLNDAVPRPPDQAGYTWLEDIPQEFETAHFVVGFDAQTGALNRLTDKGTGRDWAAPDHLLGLFRYQTFGIADYERYWDQYIIAEHRHTWWLQYDFGKAGLQTTGNHFQEFFPVSCRIYHQHTATDERFIVELATDPVSSDVFGCPRRLVVEYTFPHADSVVSLDFQWFDKPACRMPEALWLSINPVTTQPHHWQIDKLGQLISPLEVVRNGNRKLHATGRGVLYSDDQHTLSVETLDTPLVAPSKPGLLNFDNRQPVLENGMHFNLFNNIWGTNFPMWYDEDARLRFKLTYDYPILTP